MNNSENFVLGQIVKNLEELSNIKRNRILGITEGMLINREDEKNERKDIKR